MKVEYLGHSCFKLTTAKGTTIVTDPYRGVGYELPLGLYADVVTVSHGHFDHNYTEGVCAKAVITSPSPVCYKDVKIRGISCYHDEKKGTLRGENTVFLLEADGLVLCHMGDVGEACSPKLVEKIGRVDVLMLPVGGTYTVDAIGAKAYIDALQPQVVLPMHYKPTDGSLDIDGIASFLKLYEGSKIQRVTDGRTEIDAVTSGIIYMERIK